MNMKLSSHFCEETQKLITSFFEKTETTELTGTLGLILEVFIQHAQVEKADLANAASLINRLNLFFFNLKVLQDKQADSESALVDEDPQQCTHN